MSRVFSKKSNVACSTEKTSWGNCFDITSYLRRINSLTLSFDCEMLKFANSQKCFRESSNDSFIILDNMAFVAYDVIHNCKLPTKSFINIEWFYFANLFHLITSNNQFLTSLQYTPVNFENALLRVL